MILFASALAHAEFDYSSYKVEDFRNAVSALEKDSNVDYFVETNFAKYRVSAKYTGKMRTINPNTRRLIIQWARALQLPKEYQEQLSYEVQIESEGELYWLPIQTNIIEPFSKEVKVNTTVSLYIVAIGSMKLIPVFGICEFEVGNDV